MRKKTIIEVETVCMNNVCLVNIYETDREIKSTKDAYKAVAFYYRKGGDKIRSIHFRTVTRYNTSLAHYVASVVTH